MQLLLLLLLLLARAGSSADPVPPGFAVGQILQRIFNSPDEFGVVAGEHIVRMEQASRIRQSSVRRHLLMERVLATGKGRCRCPKNRTKCKVTFPSLSIIWLIPYPNNKTY